ncbi:hypothetical protein [Rhizobium sp. 1399]|uniref:hypothetical protein n=1 Tax=Rhizobium sp. 1399 TaxID=2817758 RepID=UPI00285DADEE|nr:hypothetical protein [Rhizobium sp. 1399]MDR6670213.1 hypothetical protein [Rhizobium sp. 1399]
MHADDGKLFREHFQQSSRAPVPMPRSVEEVLKTPSGGITKWEIGRLARSMQVASVAGLVEPGVGIAATLISQQMTNTTRYVDFSNAGEWIEAISWARAQPDFNAHAAWSERVQNVGEAFARLIKRGFNAEITAYGVALPEQSHTAILDQIEAHVRLIGGEECAKQIFRILNDANSTHDGFFVFGNRVFSHKGSNGPAYPWGWLLALAIANFNHHPKARKPAVVWRNLIDLASDFAAAHDCQRYSQYEQLTSVPGEDFETVMRETMLWREFFSMPQGPYQLFDKVADALNSILTAEDRIALGFDMGTLQSEIRYLLSKTNTYSLNKITADAFRARTPMLWQKSYGRRGVVNKGFRKPSETSLRDHERFLALESFDGDTILLPRPLAANTACEMIFRELWTALPRSRAAKIIGDVLETLISASCQSKVRGIAQHDVRYTADKAKYQIDVGTREQDTIVLFETKAKSLTAGSRSGFTHSAFKDYADSFLAMLVQLVRHDHYLRTIPIPPLTSEPICPEKTKLFKVAVSPLSYGPIMDRLLNTNTITALVGRTFHSVEPTREYEKAMSDFNGAMREIADGLTKIIEPDSEGRLDVFPYFIDVYWIDLGQLLYALDRAPSVSAAFLPLKHLTFGSRDFWTEIAFADQQGHTVRHGWRPAAKG